MKQFLKTATILTTAVLAAGCGTMGHALNIGSNIVDDAMELNEAYGQVSNAVIIKNILRARDRWPTSYTTLSAITSSPTLTRGSDINFSPLGLGNPSGPLQGTTSKFTNSSKAGNTYSIAPYTADKAGATSLLTPISAEKFESYFTRWPKDVVLLSMVDGVKGRHGFIKNDGENIGKFIHEMADAFYLTGQQKIDFDIGRHLRVVTKSETEQYLMLRPGRGLGISAMQANTKLAIDLRSFDSMIYYFGESLRSDQRPLKMKCYVNTPSGVREYSKRTKLVNLTPEYHTMPVDYAIRIKHANQAYYAMPNASQYKAYSGCFDDRTSSVVSLLSQLLILGQNPAALNASPVFISN